MNTTESPTAANQRQSSERRFVLFAEDRELRRVLTTACSNRSWELVLNVDLDPYSPFWSSIDVVVADVCPDGIPRLDMIRAAKARAPSAVILAVTSYPSVALVVAAMKAGAAACLAMPIHPSDIVQMIDNDGLSWSVDERIDLPSLGKIEWDYIARVLENVGGNISRAARILGIQRSTLQRKLKKYPPNR